VTAALGSPTGQSFNRAFVNGNGYFTELPEAKFPARRTFGSECLAVLPKANRFDDVLYCVKVGGVWATASPTSATRAGRSPG
jgi:hypothetical protein